MDKTAVFSFSEDTDGLTTGMVNCLLVDSSGRLWVGAYGRGLAVTEDPAASRPAWRRIGTSDGLAGEAVLSLVEDRLGRIYAGTLKGLDRFDPATGRIEHFDTSSGLVNNMVGGAVAAPMSPEIAAKVVRLFAQLPRKVAIDEHLTPQETNFLKLLAEGYSYASAAGELGVSVNTVRNYVRSIYDKLHVHSKSEAVSKALRAGLI